MAKEYLSDDFMWEEIEKLNQVESNNDEIDIPLIKESETINRQKGMKYIILAVTAVFILLGSLISSPVIIKKILNTPRRSQQTAARVKKHQKTPLAIPELKNHLSRIVNVSTRLPGGNIHSQIARPKFIKSVDVFVLPGNALSSTLQQPRRGQSIFQIKHLKPQQVKKIIAQALVRYPKSVPASHKNNFSDKKAAITIPPQVEKKVNGVYIIPDNQQLPVVSVKRINLLNLKGSK